MHFKSWISALLVLLLLLGLCIPVSAAQKEQKADMYQTAFAEWLSRERNESIAPTDAYVARSYGVYEGFELLEMDYPRPVAGWSGHKYPLFPDYETGIVSSSFLVVFHDGQIDDVSDLLRRGVLTPGTVLRLYAVGNERLSRFEDVSAESWLYEPMLYATLYEITFGKDDTHFAPEELCTRAQAVSFLCRTSNLTSRYHTQPVSETSVMGFTDVSQAAYYARPVQWAVNNEIVQGVTVARFAPDKPITREQFITMLWRMCGCPQPDGEDIVFSDVRGRYSETAIRWAAEQGLALGVTQDSFAPTEPCTRGQIAAFLYREANRRP